MTYILDLGLWHVGPFPTHIAAQHWAETHGVENYRMIPLDDPAEAPAKVFRYRQTQDGYPLLAVTVSSKLYLPVTA